MCFSQVYVQRTENKIKLSQNRNYPGDSKLEIHQKLIKIDGYRQFLVSDFFTVLVKSIKRPTTFDKLNLSYCYFLRFNPALCVRFCG